MSLLWTTHPSGKIISHSRFQTGSEELLNFSSGPFLSSLINEPPSWKYQGVIKSVTPAPQSPWSGRRLTCMKKTNRSFFSGLASTSGVREPPTFLLIMSATTAKKPQTSQNVTGSQRWVCFFFHLNGKIVTIMVLPHRRQWAHCAAYSSPGRWWI